jgi:glutathione S-transferase
MAVTELRLFHSPGSCSTAAHILLKESGLPFSTEMINVMQGFPVEFLHLNPKGRVPFLHMNGETITEMPAIMTAIAQLVPDKMFLGSTNLETVRCYEWFNFLAGELHAQGYFTLYRPHYFIDDEAACEHIQEKGRAKIDRCYGIIEEKLEGLHAVGVAFSAVDAYLLPFYRWGTANGFAMKEKYPKYTALVQNLAGMKSIRNVCEVEGIDPIFGGRPQLSDSMIEI